MGILVYSLLWVVQDLYHQRMTEQLRSNSPLACMNCSLSLLGLCFLREASMSCKEFAICINVSLGISGLRSNGTQAPVCDEFRCVPHPCFFP